MEGVGGEGGMGAGGVAWLRAASEDGSEAAGAPCRAPPPRHARH